MPPSHHHTRIVLSNEGGYYYLRLPQRLSVKEAQALVGVYRHLQEKSRANVVADLQDTTFMDSQSLGQLARLGTLIKKKGGRIAVTGLQPRMTQLIRSTRLDDLMETFDDVAAAVAAFFPDPPVPPGAVAPPVQ